jgi:hypothetical protein
MGIDEGLCNCCRSEGISLNKDFCFCFIDLADDCFSAASFRAETDLGLSVVEGEVGSVGYVEAKK